MKKLIAVLGMSAVVLSCGLFCVSCSDDDNEGGEGGSGGSSDVETCYLDVDGKRVNFKYAYYYSFDFEEDSEGECRLDFYDIDMMYYYKHPDKIKEGIIYSSASIDFYNVSGLATGTYTDVAVGIYLNDDLYASIWDGDGEYARPSSFVMYSDDWTLEQPCSIALEKSGKCYSVSADMNLLAGEPGEPGVGFDARKTTGKFVFDGEAEDLSSWVNFAKTRGVKVYKVENPDFIKWLDSLRNK